ncbi:serine O-acetyltransferase [Moheibacter stercoris]|uniref:Serine acetyltransferase n=1 Tax=Moheibacter stercoris TaxID=1628251 RepID=A0ABV2LTD2_9FLAO
MPSLLQQDYYRKTGKYESVTLWKVLFDPGLLFLYFLRHSQRTSAKSPMGIFYRLMLRRYQVKYGFQISAKTQIAGGLYLGHWGTVVVNPKAKIGKNCNLAHGVTIGQTNRGDKQGVPVIGDNVWIGTNSVIVGGITIGNNVLIAPNSYVTSDVEDDSIVVGNPARTMKNDKATDGYINNQI